MLSTNHPDDERLSALASRDAVATEDSALTAHVEACDRCTSLVGELSAIRAALAGLPDLAPRRSLRLVPEVSSDAGAERAGSWVRRIFGPVMAAGATMALVGLVGTAGPLFSGMAASGGAAPSAAQEAEMSAELFSSGGQPAAAAPSPDRLAGESGEDHGFTDEGSQSAAMSPAARDSADDGGARSSSAQEQVADLATGAERSPWPMVLFGGVALMIGVALLRWILAPRAG